MHRNYPLLLTATIVPQTQYELNLKDSDKRYRQYIDNLIRLITTTDFTHFVFCENSNIWVKDQQMIDLLCIYYDKKIEFLSFQWDAEKTKLLTRAFGDQEIMEYAVQHSSILSDFEWFYKLTWRYWIKNINQIIKKWNTSKNVFMRWWLWKNTVHTCFFKVTKDYFNRHFAGKTDQLTRFENNSLERFYYYFVKQSWVNMSINWLHPVFSWERWAGGMMDESPLMQLKTKIFAKLWVYDIKTTPIITLKNKISD